MSSIRGMASQPYTWHRMLAASAPLRTLLAVCLATLADAREYATRRFTLVNSHAVQWFTALVRWSTRPCESARQRRGPQRALGAPATAGHHLRAHARISKLVAEGAAAALSSSARVPAGGGAELVCWLP